jgi:hypothetical protein
VAQDDYLSRSPRDCLAPYGFGQYVVLDLGYRVRDLGLMTVLLPEAMKTHRKRPIHSQLGSRRRAEYV